MKYYKQDAKDNDLYMLFILSSGGLFMFFIGLIYWFDKNKDVSIVSYEKYIKEIKNDK